MNLTRNNWPAGWVPAEDAINGDPNALLRADNLTTDKSGAIGLVDGSKFLAALSDSVGAIFSRTIEGKEYFWIGTGSGSVRYDQSWTGPVDLTAVPGSGAIGTAGLSAFGDAFGATIGINGAFRVKDSGPNLGAFPLGILTPVDKVGNGPTGIVNPQQPTSVLPSNYFIIQGTTASGSGGFAVAPDLTISTGIIIAVPPFTLDTTNIGGFGQASNINNDIIQLPFSVTSPGQQVAQIQLSNLQAQLFADELSLQANPTSAYLQAKVLADQQQIAVAQASVTTVSVDLSDVNSVAIYFLLDGDPTNRTTWRNFYIYTFSGADTFTTGSQSTTLSIDRGSFTRIGNNSLLDWTKVISVVIVASDGILGPICIGPISIIGGPTGQVNGVYNYAQVSVNNNGVYLAKSPMSPLAVNATSQTGLDNNFSVINGSVTLFVIGNDPQANEYWFYRRSSAPPLPLIQTQDYRLTTLLYGLAICWKSDRRCGTFLDTLSDQQVIQLNIDGSLLPNPYLQTLCFCRSSGRPPKATLRCGGIVQWKMLYMDTNNIYISDFLNPDAIDPRFTLKPSGDGTEVNLWIKKLTNNVIILGTTKDLYEITGTLTVAPDGTIDAQIIAIGEAYPPISLDVCNDNGGLYYIAPTVLGLQPGQ